MLASQARRVCTLLGRVAIRQSATTINTLWEDYVASVSHNGKAPSVTLTPTTQCDIIDCYPAGLAKTRRQCGLSHINTIRSSRGPPASCSFTFRWHPMTQSLYTSHDPPPPTFRALGTECSGGVKSQYRTAPRSSLFL